MSPVSMVSVNGGEPMPCDAEAEFHSGFKHLTISVRDDLFHLLGVVVKFQLQMPNGRRWEGRGLITSVKPEPRFLSGVESTLLSSGEVLEVAAE